MAEGKIPRLYAQDLEIDRRRLLPFSQERHDPADGPHKARRRLLRPVHALGESQSENGAGQNFRQNLHGGTSRRGLPQRQVFPFGRGCAGSNPPGGRSSFGQSFPPPACNCLPRHGDLDGRAEDFLHLVRLLCQQRREREPPAGGGSSRFAGAVREPPLPLIRGVRRFQATTERERAPPEPVHPSRFQRRAGSAREFPRTRLPAATARSLTIADGRLPIGALRQWPSDRLSIVACSSITTEVPVSNFEFRISSFDFRVCVRHAATSAAGCRSR